MDDQEVKYKNDSEHEFHDVIKELKSLPLVKLPSDFDRELRDKIALYNMNKKKPFFSYESYSKALVFGGSFIVVICLVIFSVTIFRNTNEPVINGVAIDSASYGGKKVVVIPPTENTSVQGAVDNTIEKKSLKREKAISPQEMKEYFGEEKADAAAPSVRSNTFLAPSANKKSMEMDRSINVDTLRKKDSIKKANNKK